MSWLIHSSIQLAIFTVIVAFFAMLFRKSSAQILFILFLLIFVKALIPPGFALPCGVGNWGLEPVRYYVVSFFETRKTIDETAPYQAIHDVEHHSPPVNPERFQVETVAATRISQDEMSTVSTVSTVSKILFWITNNPLLSIWLVGFCGALGILIRSSIKISLLIHRSREVERGKFQGLYGKARIYISDETLIPFVAGFWRQNIILPQVLFDNEDLDNEDLDNEDLDNEDLDNEDLDNEDLENLSDSRKKLVENILLHEQAHLMRMDIPIAYFVALVQACFWFHPFLWWAGRQLALWRERACDEMVLASERTNSELYGRALLDVLLLAQGKNTTRYTALGIFERNVKIQTRLEKIMSYHKTPYQFRCEWILLIFFAFCFLPMGCYVFSDDVKPVRENQSSVKQTEDQITEKSVPVLKNKENIIIEFYVLASNKTTDEKEKALMASASGDASASGNDQSEYRSDILDGYEGVRWLPVLETLAEQWKRISIEKNAGVILRRKESDKGLEMEEVLVLIPSKERRIVPDDFEQINYESQNGMDQIKFSLTAEGGKRMKRLSMPLVEKSPKTARTPRFLAVVRVQENLRILVTAAPVYAELERHGLVQFEGISKKNSVSQPSVISCRENLKQIVLAFHNYYAIDNKFPPSATVDSKGKPLHSWRVLILPYLEQNDLYKKIRLNEPWDSEYNKQFHDQMPDVYRCTVKNYGPGMTIFSVVTGKEAAFPRWGLARGFENITDGTSNTLAVVERKKPVCWMDPTSDITFTEAVNNDINSSSGDGLGSAHKGGFWGARFDGRVDAIYDDELPMEKRKAVLTISGGERVDIPSHRTMVGEQETIPDQKIIEEQKIQQKIDAYQILTARIPIFDSKWLKNETLQAKAREEVEKFNTWRNEVNEKFSTFTETLDPAGQSAFAFWQMNCIQFCHLTEEVTLCRELWDKEPSLRPILLFWVDYILIISEQSNNPDFHAELLKIKNMEDDSKRFHRMCDWLNSIRSKDTRDQSLKLMDKERYKIGQPIPEEILVLENKLNRQLCIINIYIQYNTFQPKYRTTAIKNCEEIAAELDKLEPNWRKRLSSPKR